MFERVFAAVMSVLANGNLSQNPNRVSGADVVGALGRCDPLGAAIYRVYATNDVTSWRAAARLLAERVKPDRPVDNAVYERVAAVALYEYVGRACEHCNGTGMRADDRGVRRTCGACHGTGQHQVVVRHRSTLLGLSDHAYRPLASVFDDCRDALREAEYAAGAMIAYQLGRRKFPPREPNGACLV